MDEKKEYPSYIICYTLRINQNNGDYKDLDYWVVFCEIDENGITPRQQVKYYLKKLKRNKDLYTWNIAKIVDTSEHYKTSK